MGFDPKTLQDFDPKTVNRLDWAIIGIGVLSLLLSFFGYYTYTASVKSALTGFSVSTSFSAWHGFFGWFAAVLAFAAAVVLAGDLIAKVTLPFPVRLAVFGGFALASLSVIIALVVHPGAAYSYSGLGYSVHFGHGLTYWLSLLIILGGTALSYLRLIQTGGKLPGRP